MIASPRSTAPPPAHEGSGLGLAVAKGLLEAMGGRIGVEAAPDRGSTLRFEVALPRAEADGSAAGPPPHAAGKRVLSIDHESHHFIVHERLRS